MARPLIATDEEILNAATRVLARRGPDLFTLSEVARELGLTRAAIAYRVKNARELKLKSLDRDIQRYAELLKRQNFGKGGDGLIAISEFIGSRPSSRKASSASIAVYLSKISDPDLLKLERRRGAYLKDAIAATMPEMPVSREAAVQLFSEHLTGALMAWQASEEPDGRKYLGARTREWLRIAQIPFHDDQQETAHAAVSPETELIPLIAAGQHPAKDGSPRRSGENPTP